jgi:glucoamylase
MPNEKAMPPGAPGIPARWTSSAKSGVGCALSAQSNVWFTISHGILNEIYYPRIDQACTRDLGLIVTNGHDFFSEEKRHTASTIRPIADGVPAFNIVSTCAEGRYRIEKTILTDPRRDVVLQRVRFRSLAGALADYRMFVLLAPHLVNRGAGNTGWVGDYKGIPMLFAEGAGTALALGCSAPFLARSAGFVGMSDGWQDLSRHFSMHWQYDRAPNGNVALTGEVDISASGAEFVLALGFGQHPEEAALRARASLCDDIDGAVREYVAGWQEWQGTLRPLDRKRGDGESNTYRIGTAVLRTHEARSLAGGHIASLSVPWGFAKGDEDLGGYHLVWPRDLVEVAGGFLAIGAKSEARSVVRYLQAIQEPDGHWPQNCWIDGTAYWNGVQMDECALPILLVDMALREGALSAAELEGLWPMVRAAAAYLVCNGPVTAQDGWEEDGGYSPFTLAVEIAALLSAADFAERIGSGACATYLRETADAWNDSIERWIFATDTPLAQQLGVPGYYVRIAPPESADATSPIGGFVPIKNRPPEQGRERAVHIVSPDALALVRFGLRAPDDPRILATVHVIDALLKIDLPAGPCWHRYNGDGYGEHADGHPFDGTGIGRAWPLLTGERAHYELAAGRAAEAERLLSAIEGFANDGKLIPEQVWDAADIPERELFHGRPSGSAMPLAWAHAEHLKLLRSLADGRVFDMPPQPHERYQLTGVKSPHAVWRFNQKCRSFPPNRILRIEIGAAVVVHWTLDEWRTIHDTPSRDSGLGMHFVDIPTAECTAGSAVVFTFFWPEARRWEGVDYRITVA